MRSTFLSSIMGSKTVKSNYRKAAGSREPLRSTGYDAARRGIETLDRAEIAFQVQIVQGAIRSQTRPR